MARAEHAGFARFIAVDIGRTGMWGWPTSKQFKPEWRNVPLAITDQPKDHFDVVLVDGRFRVACALQALPHVKADGGILIFHDYYNRKGYYGSIEKWYEPVARGNVLGVFKKRRGVAPPAEKDFRYDFAG